MTIPRTRLKDSFDEFVEGFRPYFSVIKTAIHFSEPGEDNLAILFGREAGWIAADFMNSASLNEETHQEIIDDFRMAFAPYTSGAIEAPLSSILRAMVKMSEGKYRSNISDNFKNLIRLDSFVEENNLRDRIPPLSHIYVTNAMGVAASACQIAGLKKHDIDEIFNYVNMMRDEINQNLESKLDIDLEAFRPQQSNPVFYGLVGVSVVINTDDIIKHSLKAINSSTPTEELEALSNHESGAVRGTVASNPRTSIEILSSLAKDNEFTVRINVASNSELPPELQAILVNDEEPLVRKALASNQKISNALLDTLVKDRDEDVRQVAIATHPLTSTQRLTNMSKSHDEDVRLAVARNPNTSDKTLIHLSRDQETRIKKALLDRDNLPLESLLRLIKDEDEGISSRALEVSREFNIYNNEEDYPSTGEGGHLYILMNASMPGIIKIGKTGRHPETRANELSSHTGIPTPFVVVYEQYFHDLDSAEKTIHALLNNYRVSNNREFFKISSSQAIKIMMTLSE